MAYLTIEESDGRRQQIAISGAQVILGRGDDVDVCFDAEWVSSHHARITKEDGDYFISDNDSSNGTFVNYERVTKQKLEDNDLIFLGRTKMVFRETRALLEESTVELDILSDDASGIFTQVPEPDTFVRHEAPEPPALEDVEKRIIAHEPVEIPDEVLLKKPDGDYSRERIEALERALQQSQLEYAKLQTEAEAQQRRAEQEISRLLDELTTWKSRYFEVLENQKAHDSNES